MSASRLSTPELRKNGNSPNRRSICSLSFGSDSLIQPTKLLLSSNILSSLNESNSEIDEKNETIRDKFRKATGVSLTALRVTIRASTGFSLTALRTTLRGLTGVSITGTLKVITGAFPLWARSFFQPFLILYYTPLLILRSLIGSRKGEKDEAKATHELITEGWKNAIKAAEEAQEGGYWPVHVNKSGMVEVSLPPEPNESRFTDVTEGVAQSVEFVMNQKNE